MLGRRLVDATRWVAVAENSVREVSAITQSDVLAAIGEQCVARYARLQGKILR
jgi:hypothetical protein